MSNNIEQPLRKRTSLINYPPQPYMGDLPTRPLTTEPLPQRQHVPNESRIVRTSDDTIFKEKVSDAFSSSRKLVSFFSLVIILLALPVSLFLVNLQRQFQQPAARAAGSTYYANPGDSLASKVNSLQPGDTLLLNDGVYYSPLTISGKQGTATAPITIKAVNDGKAIVDGSQITATYTPPVFIGGGSAYIDVEGIVARNAPQSNTDPNVNENVIYVYGNSNNTLGGADHITLRRITAYNAAPGNHHLFMISFGATNVLVEDCAAWGDGRYRFIAYQADHVTFRRDWAYWDNITDTNTEPRSGFSVYGATNVTLENVIAINTISKQTDDNYYTATWQTSANAPWTTSNTTILGSMFYNNWEGWWVNGDTGVNTQFKDDYFDIQKLTGTYTTKPQGNGLMWGTTNGGSITNATFTNNVQGFYNSHGAPPSLTNTLFLNNPPAINNDPGHSYSDFYGNTSNGTALVATDKQVNPGYDTTTYGRGAYLFVPNNSPLKGAGANGADIGANIIYEYVDGQLTNTPLWPWPMEDRIMAEKGISVTYAANGGIWKTLSGIYSNTTITSTPTSTPFPTNTLTPTPPLVPDTTSPTVNITNPLNASTVKHGTTVTITATASDNVGVSKVEFSVNNSLLCTDTTAPYTCAWTVPGKRGTTYTITAKVYDEAGNSAINIITATSSR